MSAVMAVSETMIVCPRIAWMRRVLRVGGMIQAGFAAFWPVRGSLAVYVAAGRPLAALFGIVALAVLVYGACMTAGRARRPKARAPGRSSVP